MTSLKFKPRDLQRDDAMMNIRVASKYEKRFGHYVSLFFLRVLRVVLCVSNIFRIYYLLFTKLLLISQHSLDNRLC